MKDNCIFCRIANGEIESEKIFESENFFVIKDINPKVEGHCLIIPKRHYETLLDMPSSLYGEFLECAKEVAFKLIKEVRVGGFNLVMNNKKVAGQLVPHIHMHILPRKDGDGFSLSV